MKFIHDCHETNYRSLCSIRSACSVYVWHAQTTHRVEYFLWQLFHVDKDREKELAELDLEKQA